MVPTLTFERLFAFLVLSHDRRQLLWFEVTRHPTAEWLARQITEAFPWASAPAYLVRDNDRAYGHAFRSRVRAMGIRDRPIAPGSPWQNPYVERLIGTVRRECLDGMHAPLSRTVQRSGVIVAIPILSRAAPPLRSDMIFGKHTTQRAKKPRSFSTERAIGPYDGHLLIDGSYHATQLSQLELQDHAVSLDMHADAARRTAIDPK